MHDCTITSSARTNNPPVPAAIHHFFDRISFQLPRFSEREEGRLRAQSHSLTEHHDWWHVVAPNEVGLRILTQLPKVQLVGVELARDEIADDETVTRRQQQFVEGFVHRWHGKHQVVTHKNTTYTGQRRRGRRFVWYSDRHCKLTGEVACFHLEARYWGAQVLRRIGIHRVSDLLTFDHDAYWRQNLHLYTVDLEALGRHYLKRVHGRRRQTWTVQCGPLSYDILRCMGCVVWRHHACHPTVPIRTVQLLIDHYGRGTFLRPLPPHIIC